MIRFTLLVVASVAPGQALGAEFIQGMTVSCPMNGRVWGTAAMKDTLQALSGLGVQSVAIHPYARISRDGGISYEPAAETAYLWRAARYIAEARQSMFLKPHLSYWGSFKWRGDIEFGADEAAWDRFFTTYRAWILDQARFARTAGAPIFAVGVELDATAHRVTQWRRIIADVRKVYSGKITFASNWDRYREVHFWRDLDFVGVQAYFPLGEGRTDPASLRRSWRKHLAQLKRVSERAGRPVLFTEIGYNRAPHAATRPWDPKTRDTPETRRLRALLMETALDEIAKVDFVVGVYWWKWIPGWAPWESDFSMRDPEARFVLESRWAKKSLRPPAHDQAPPSKTP